MLSIENSLPDPSCSYQFPQLNSDSDERASHKLPLPAEVDLPNPPLDHHTPLPNFSIRDYVFTVRSKDIKKNWPFSSKNLQLCLKHGVKELLPPFQPLDTIRKQSLKRCTVETSSVEKEKTSDFDKEASRLNSHAALDSSDDPQLNNKLAESCLDVSSCRSGDENDFPSTTTSVSQSEIESLPVNRQSSSQVETYRKRLAAVEVAGSSGNNKTENTSRPLSKKCRLIVKFGGNSDRSSTEDIASNCTTVSETMASKVCPVCKTFSSTSNTTLNAHIDQCLSVESTPKWTADSKLTRHRIKPRKTKLMVDIYSTSLPCTLEELDRRNGTSWATVSCLPMQETEKTETTNEGKKIKMSTIHPEDVGDVGPVYIDANGTKVRILSKFDDQPSVSKVGEDIEARKPLKGDKKCKHISKKKKKRLAQKHHKYLKLAPQSKKNFSHRAHDSQISGGQGEAKGCEKEHLMPKHTKPSDSGALRPWISSKRRGLIKKIANQKVHQPVRCNWHLPRDLLAENGQSNLGESLAERNLVQKFSNHSENPISSSGNSERMEKSFHKIQVSKRREQSPGRKRVGNLMAEARNSDNSESPPMKHNTIQLGNGGTTVHDSCMLRPSNSMWNYPSLLSKRTVDACGDAISNFDISCIASTKSSRDAHAILSKAMELSSLRKKILSMNGRSSVTESLHGRVKKWSALKKSQVHFMRKRDGEVATCQSAVDECCDSMHGNVENQDKREEIADESLEMSALETRQAREVLCISQGEETSALRTSKPAPRFCDHDVRVNAGSSVIVGDDFLQKVDCLDSAGQQVCVYVENIFVEPSSNASDGRRATGMIKSVDSEFCKLSSSLKVQSNSLQSVEGYRGLLCGTEAAPGRAEHDFVNDQEMFSADEVGNDMVGQNSHMGVELDSEAVHGNSFPEVDPIPIPGPPGSFLPSPRDMGSVDFQGNSSLTTSRVHSSPDQHDVVDGDSSDSLMSAASTISNSTENRCHFKYSEPSTSVGPSDKIRSTAASVESSLQSLDAVAQASGAEMERNAFDGEYLKLDRIYAEKGSLNFKNDQPCCCQRKERFSQGVALNFQESQLLRRRKMASMTIPAGGKQMDFNSNLRPAVLDLRPELTPPSSCTDPGSEKMALPLIKPLVGPFPFKDSPNAGMRFLARAGSDSASPSASNPVLRLMGKNLLVVNKDDDTSMPQLGVVQPCIRNNPQTSQFLAFSRVSNGNVQSQDCHPVNHMGLQASVFDQSSHKSVGQYYNGGLSNRLPKHNQLPAGIFHDQHTDCSFATSMECHELKGDYSISSRHNRPKNRLNTSTADNMEQVIATPDRHCHEYADFLPNPVKQVIIIDDVPESDNFLISSVAKCAEGGMEGCVVSSGVPISTAPNYNLDHMHPFSCYQSQDHSPLVESPMVHNAGFLATPSKLGNTCPVRWGCTPEGSGVLQRSPFTAASSSPGHLRSTALHYSPGFS